MYVQPKFIAYHYRSIDNTLLNLARFVSTNIMSRSSAATVNASNVMYVFLGLTGQGAAVTLPVASANCTGFTLFSTKGILFDVTVSEPAWSWGGVSTTANSYL